jgi:hypothetical protein
MVKPAVVLSIALMVGYQGLSRHTTERAIQAAAIDSLFVRDSTRAVVVRDSTISGGTHFVSEDYESALLTLGQLPTGLREDFERVRGERRAMDGLSRCVPVVFFGAEQRARIPRTGDPRGYWKSFYQEYPGTTGLIEMSRAGLSRDGHTALLLVEYGCGPLCGGTLYVLLEQRDGKWHVVRVAQPRVA